MGKRGGKEEACCDAPMVAPMSHLSIVTIESFFVLSIAMA